MANISKTLDFTLDFHLGSLKVSSVQVSCMCTSITKSGKNKGALPIRAHPFFQNLKDEFMSFPTVYDMPIFNKIWVVIYRWKAIELCFSNKGAPMLCLGALRPFCRIYGI